VDVTRRKGAVIRHDLLFRKLFAATTLLAI
jgi:hypothetical protein